MQASGPGLASRIIFDTLHLVGFLCVLHLADPWSQAFKRHRVCVQNRDGERFLQPINFLLARLGYAGVVCGDRALLYEWAPHICSLEAWDITTPRACRCKQREATMSETSLIEIADLVCLPCISRHGAPLDQL